VVAFAVCAGWPAAALAQLDVNPPLPNVILLVDSSGSMEDMADGKAVATCNPSDSVVSDMNKWTTLVSVLTGTVEKRGCYKLDRNSAEFTDEFSISNVKPWDFGVGYPHYRIVSDGCVAGAGTLPSNAYDWQSDSIKFHDYNSKTECKKYSQKTDGLLDAYRDRVRFGLMTFDGSKDKGTGLSGATGYDATTGFDGLWSYHLDWNNGGTPASVTLKNCATSPYEVGARNPVAPPWEGRMIAPGASDATLAQIRAINDQVQLALTAMRPYGGTPLAGMMADAYTFLRDDKSKDPLDSSKYWTPAGDGMVSGGCRKNFLVVLSDGEPNLDSRPICEEKDNKCPYKQPHEIAHDLYQSADPKLSVKTFAVGFGLSKVAGDDCTKLSMPTDYNAGGKCYNASGALKACCTLARIAYEGGTGRAYFADDVATLKSELSKVLSQASAGTTSRTMPIFGSTSGINVVKSQADAVAWQFTSSFDPAVGDLWSGNLERHRWVCKDVNGTLEAQLQSVEAAKGDDFADNVNKGKSSKARRFITVIADKKGKEQYSMQSIRPKLTADDGAGLYSGTVYDGGISTIATAAYNNPHALDLEPRPKGCDPLDKFSRPCGEKLMTWLLGGNNGGSMPTRSGNEFGAIYHGTPALIGPPAAHIRDEDYEQFALKNAKRPVMLYTATTDGMIHAHKVASTDDKDVDLVDSLKNNELWAFIPPHVLENVLGIYPDTQKALLDGTVVVRDVIFERSLKQAKAAGSDDGGKWRTVLVAGGGLAGGYSIALDVTDPTKPEFLWQLARNDKQEPMFGTTGVVPAIATISLKDGNDVKETAVAIIPGGAGKWVKGSKGKGKGAAKKASGKACPGRITGGGKGKGFGNIKGKYKPRKKGSCWEDGPDKNLMVVRLSDGKILRVFADDPLNVASGILSSLITDAPIDAPLTGIPVAYPSQPGQVANRAYVGDADGGLYRLDMSSTDPAKWEVDLIWDSFSLSTDTDDDGQPIEGYPVVSVDEVGNTVIVFATGDQELLQYNSDMLNRVWSITEKPIASGNFDYTIEENWVLQFKQGKRATGPISVFDGAAYFSTFTPADPAAKSACTSGYGSVWGVHYNKPEDKSDPPKPLPRLVKDPSAKAITYIEEQKQDDGSVVYGVSVQMEPPCFETSEQTDSYVGSHTAITNSTPPKFNLVFHTGNAGKTYGSGSVKTKANTVRLSSPRNTVRFDSWASVAE
jgi:type IV pilus assembly protein PilY1